MANINIPFELLLEESGPALHTTTENEEIKNSTNSGTERHGCSSFSERFIAAPGEIRVIAIHIVMPARGFNCNRACFHADHGAE